jgi:hypothetical protein
MIGTKHDEGKPLFSCIDAESLLDLGRVAAFGAKKYGNMNWVHVVDGRTRYWDAAVRHLLAAQTEFLDADSNLPHLAHAAWNCLACLFLERRTTNGNR